MRVKLLHQSATIQLQNECFQNLEKYKAGDFNYIVDDSTLSFETDIELDLDVEAVTEILDYNGHNKSPAQRASTDLNFSKLLFNSIPNLTPSLARDTRLWTFLSHTVFFQYVKNRFPLPPNDDEEALKKIKQHYFCQDERRGLERNNAVSRLWWMSFVVSRLEEMGLDQALEVFLHNTDIRASILERPTTSQNANVLTSILKVFNESIKGDGKLLVRDTYREFMKRINLLGGVILLSDLTQTESDQKISAIVDEL